ncbi:MAG: hypothetical protein IJ658_06805, partial [Kiritimatiellae bacterium]|nr:hypothetical protein [Kiritimatiellia bacterium]
MRKRLFAAGMLVATLRVAAATLGTYPDTVPTTNVVMFTGVSLADVKSVSANIGGSMSCDGIYPPATAYRYANDGTALTVQFQCYLGDYTKCVKLRLEQDGADIVGRAVYTAYVNERFRDYEGTDADGDLWGRTDGGTSYLVKDVAISDEDDSHLRTKLWWNGADGDAWDAETSNWLTESGEAVAWTPGARAVFTNGAAQAVAVAAEGVTASHLTMAGGVVTFTGGTLTMVGAAEVAMRTGAVRFECPIAGTAGLRVANLIYKTDTSSYLKADAELIAENVSLAGVERLTGTPQGSWVGADSTPMESYFVENGGTTLTAQMQWYGGGYTKCVFIELTQVGPHVYGRAVRAKYWGTRNVDCRGIDFRTQGVEQTPLFLEDGSPSYGAKNLCLDSRVTLAGANTFTGLLRTENGATLALDGGTLGGGTFADRVIFCHGALEIAHTRQKFSGKLTDTGVNYRGSLRVKGTVNPAGGTLTYAGQLPESGAVIFPDTDISGWVAAAATFKGSTSMSPMDDWSATTFFFRNDGQRVRCQFQIKNDTNNKYVKCAIYEFVQQGPDVTCRRVGSTYKGRNVWDTHFGYDFDRETTFANNYTCSDLVITYTNTTDTAVTLAAAGGWNDGTVVDGALLGVAAANAIPSATGTVTTVTSRGKLFIDYGYGSATAGAFDKTTVNLTGGSYMGICRLRAVGSRTTVNASGGSEVHVEAGNGNNAQDYGYITHLSLADGSFVSGETFRTGYEDSDYGAYISVTGNAPARIAQPMVVLRGNMHPTNPNYSNVWTWAVADVTGDEQPDLFLDGALQNYEAQAAYCMRPILKTGAGTVRLGAANSYTGSVEIA